MRDNKRAFSIDLTEPTAITYLNGMIARTPQSWAWMWASALKLERLARHMDGCLQTKAGIVSPRQIMLVSYWRDDAALRSFYPHPVHVKLMRMVFRHPNWFTLYNETYRMPESTRYWNAPNGYALSQPWRAETLQDFAVKSPLHPEIAAEFTPTAAADT